MKIAEQALLDEMITHSIKAFTEEDTGKREYHREMYQVTKRVLWECVEENRRAGNDKDS